MIDLLSVDWKPAYRLWEGGPKKLSSGKPYKKSVSSSTSSEVGENIFSLHFYRQSAAMPVLFLLSSPKIGFSPHRGDVLPR